MSRESVAAVSSAAPQTSFDTIDTILEAHLNRIITNVDVLVNAWSENGESQDGKKEALLFLYKSAICQRSDLQNFLADRFDLDEMEDDERESYNFFDGLSRHCTGDFVSNDPLLRQCQFISQLEKGRIANHAAEYFRTRFTSYLRENFPQFGYANDELVETQLSNIANDTVTPSVTSGVIAPRCAEMFRDSSLETERK